MEGIRNNEFDYEWEETIDILSLPGYYIFEGIHNAQSELDSYYRESTEPLWKKTGRMLLRTMNDNFKQKPIGISLSRNKLLRNV